MDVEPNFIDVILLLAGTSLLAVLAMTRLRLSPIMGYLLVGVVVGPHGLGWVQEMGEIRLLAELGVIFLMFTIGLEFSLPRLLADKGVVLGLGGTQVLLTTALFAAGAWLAGLGGPAAFAVGTALAMSSTAIVTRQLLEQGVLASRVGQTTVGVLLFQDLATVLVLLVLPALQAGTTMGAVSEVVAVSLQGAAVFLALVVLGRWGVRPFFRRIAAQHSPELFMVGVVLASLGAARFAQWAGLSPMLGGFLAGMVLGETEFRHQVAADIRPFQDVLLGVFFISMGTLLDLALVSARWPEVLALAVALVLAKGALVAVVGRLSGLAPATALRCAALLAHGGEFSLVILYLGMETGAIASAPVQVALSAVLLTMLAAPVMVRGNQRIAGWLGGQPGSAGEVEPLRPAAANLSDHVILGGFGRVGQSVARLLEGEGFDYVAVDLDPERVRDAAAGGEPVAYGDITQRANLQAAGLERARAAVMTFRETRASLKALSHIQELRPELPVLVRATDEHELEDLLNAGVTEVVPDTVEASVTLATHLLLLLGVPVSQVAQRIDLIRSDRYRLLRGLYHGREAPGVRAARLRVVRVAAGAFATGRTLGELGLERYGVRVNAVRRRGIRGEDPAPTMRIQSGDVLILQGPLRGLERAERALLIGRG